MEAEEFESLSLIPHSLTDNNFSIIQFLAFIANTYDDGGNFTILIWFDFLRFAFRFALHHKT